MMDYALPRAAWLPHIELANGHPVPDQPARRQGRRRGRHDRRTAAVANAVDAALRPLGIRHLDPPLHIAVGLVRDPGREGRPGMIPAAFDYVRPGSIEEAAQAAGQPGAKVIAGGQSLLPLMKLRLARPTTLVDIGRIAGLVGTRYTEGRRSGDRGDDDLRPDHGRDASSSGPATPSRTSATSRSVISARSAARWRMRTRPPTRRRSSSPWTTRRSLRSRSRRAGCPPRRLLHRGIHDFRPRPTRSLWPLRRPPLPVGVGGAYEKLPVPASGYAVVGVAVVIARSGGSISHARVALTGVGGASIPGEGGGVGARRLGWLGFGDCRGRGTRHRWPVGQLGHPCQFGLSFSDGRGPHPSRDRGRPRPQRLIRRTGTGAPRTGHARPERARPSCWCGPRPRPEDR